MQRASLFDIQHRSGFSTSTRWVDPAVHMPPSLQESKKKTNTPIIFRLPSGSSSCAAGKNQWKNGENAAARSSATDAVAAAAARSTVTTAACSTSGKG
jgi:hypothetical protein